MEDKEISIKKSTLILVSLSLIFIFVLGFVIWDLYLKDKNDISNIPDMQKLSKDIQKPEQKTEGNSSGGKEANLSSTTFDSCINNTADNPQCKDCCDCLTGADGETRTNCRNICATHDFTKNSNILLIKVPSILGLNADYSTCTAKASSGDCKICCEDSLGLVCGDYQYCRTACNTQFGTKSGPENVTS